MLSWIIANEPKIFEVTTTDDLWTEAGSICLCDHTVNSIRATVTGFQIDGDIKCRMIREITACCHSGCTQMSPDIFIPFPDMESDPATDFVAEAIEGRVHFKVKGITQATIQWRITIQNLGG